MKKITLLLLTVSLFFGFSGNSAARDFARFIPISGTDNSNLLQAIVFSYDSQNGRYRYRLISAPVKGVPLLHLDDGASVVAEKTEGGLYKVKYVSLNNGSVQELDIDGVIAKNLQTIQAREGDKRSVHIAWLQPDDKTLSYMHIDSTTNLLHTLHYAYENEIRLPPPFFMLPHVLVGRNHVGLLKGGEKEGNPVALLDIFSVGYDQIGAQQTVSGGSSVAQVACEGNDFKGSFSGVISALGNCVRVDDTVAEPTKGAEPTKPAKKKGFFKIGSDIEAGSPISPQGDHAWYGDTYLALSYHIVSNDDLPEFRRVAVLIGDKGVFPDSRKIGTDVMLLSNLTGPINRYQGEIGRGGIAWLEAHPGNEILINVFREGSLDTATPLNAEVAGAITVGHAGKKTLYWIDQGENYQPILFILAGKGGNLYQVDLEDPDAFTVMPSDEPGHDVIIWPALNKNDNSSVAFIVSISDEGDIRDIYHLSRRWKGANLDYRWDQLEK